MRAPGRARSLVGKRAESARAEVAVPAGGFGCLPRRSHRSAGGGTDPEASETTLPDPAFHIAAPLDDRSHPASRGLFLGAVRSLGEAMRILVTGTSGFIGGELAPALLARGHEVVGLARSAERVPATLRDRIDLVVGDASSPTALDRALEGCDAFAWLLHSMEADPNGVGFAARELDSVRGAIEAARRAGVERAVYLGGMEPSSGPESAHLGSRLAVERELLRELPDSTALRASIVIGSRSRSFRFLVRLVERLPALPLPAWRDNRTAPADVRDVVAALTACLEGAAPGESLDLACPEELSYGELIELIAERMLLDRPRLGLPFSLTRVAGPVAAAVAGEDPELIVPLMGSLGEDILPRSDGLARLGLRPHRLDAAIDRALREWEESEELAAR